jgi:hypothetical protein
MKVILKCNNTCRGSLVLHSYQDSLKSISAVLRKLKMYENVIPPFPFKEKKIKIKKPASLQDTYVYQI